MFNIGIDFDNTLVHYDKLFFDIALREGLIDSNIEKSKIAVREYLVNKGKESLFTKLQGEVYGLNILSATPSKNAFQNIRKFNDLGMRVYIISHKTKYPYIGEKYDLHKAAKKWLKHYLFLSPKGAKISEENVFFNVSKDEKIKKIHDLKCDFFIDDLPEILNMVKPNIKKILYNKILDDKKYNFDLKTQNWDLIGNYICSFL